MIDNDCFDKNCIFNRSMIFNMDFLDLCEILESLLNRFSGIKQEEDESLDEYKQRESQLRSLCTLLTKAMGEFTSKKEDQIVFLKVNKIRR